MGPRFRGDDAAAVGRGPSVASAKPRAAADFYQGKTLRIVISTGVAGGFGEYARLLSEHIGRHIAGRPHVIVQSMPGAGGLLAANYLYASAPQDGTTIGIINSTVPFAPLWGSKGARFDTLKFNWLGTLDRAEGVCTLWHTSPVKTWSRHAGRRSSRSGASARARRWSSTRRCSTSCSRPGSR